MSYSIPIIFYGIPLVVNDDLDRTETVDQLIEDKPPGVHTYYSGNGTHCSVAGFGIPLQSLSEGDHHSEARNLRFTPTAEQIGEFRKLYAALDPEYKAAVDECGTEPRTIILWTSS